jgi:hypothetical protein
MTRATPPKPGVLTTDSTVTCGHTPFGTVIGRSDTKLRVAGSPVLVVDSLKPGTMIGAGCTASKQGDVPCASVKEVTKGPSTKLRAGGSSVMLSSLGGTTNGVINGVPGVLTVAKAQSKLAAP